MFVEFAAHEIINNIEMTLISKHLRCFHHTKSNNVFTTNADEHLMMAVRGVLGWGARIVTWSQINLDRVNGLEWSLTDAIFKAIPESCKRCLNPAACSNCFLFSTF